MGSARFQTGFLLGRGGGYVLRRCHPSTRGVCLRGTPNNWVSGSGGRRRPTRPPPTRSGHPYTCGSKIGYTRDSQTLTKWRGRTRRSDDHPQQVKNRQCLPSLRSVLCESIPGCVLFRPRWWPRSHFRAPCPRTQSRLPSSVGVSVP